MTNKLDIMKPEFQLRNGNLLLVFPKKTDKQKIKKGLTLNVSLLGFTLSITK